VRLFEHDITALALLDTYLIAPLAGMLLLAAYSALSDAWFSSSNGAWADAMSGFLGAALVATSAFRSMRHVSVVGRCVRLVTYCLISAVVFMVADELLKRSLDWWEAVCGISAIVLLWEIAYTVYALLYEAVRFPSEAKLAEWDFQIVGGCFRQGC
jgi:hypothetical protein